MDFIIKMIQMLVRNYYIKDEISKELAVLSKRIARQNNLWWVLLRGIFNGFGIFVGSVILIAILIWILSLLNTAPIIGDYVSKIVDVVNQKRH